MCGDFVGEGDGYGGFGGDVNGGGGGKEKNHLSQ